MKYRLQQLNRLTWLLMLLGLWGSADSARSQTLAVKTNLLSDAVLVPSLGGEVVLS
ncbi:MAG: DUF3575 domain-containing protein, partial [Prevotella sp.]|nr:DUF3575 domain-containing protein [Prevotella sp.]